MPAGRLLEFLDEAHLKYISIQHSKAYTAQGVAALTHIPGKELAKTVIVKIDGKFAMAVLPATRRIDLNLLKTALNAENIELASEFEFCKSFPDCEIGAMPPFGNLYDMPVYVEATLAEDEEIAFNAGSHYEVIRMRYADFARLVSPRVLRFAYQSRAIHAA